FAARRQESALPGTARDGEASPGDFDHIAPGGPAERWALLRRWSRPRGSLHAQGYIDGTDSAEHEWTLAFTNWISPKRMPAWPVQRALTYENSLLGCFSALAGMSNSERVLLASVRRHRRAQGGSPMLRSIRPKRPAPERRESSVLGTCP